jgi:Na+-driven multidrug efflux pump
LSPPLQNESVRARLVRLAAPVVGLNLLNVTVLFVDTAMCSRLPEKTLALEALSFAGQLVFLFTVLMMGLTVGTVALVARAHGAGDRLRASHLLVQSTQLTVLVGILVAIVGD